MRLAGTENRHHDVRTALTGEQSDSIYISRKQGFL
jgi:hypothetical protein